ncbi:MAG: efflux RND transporter periplasmic adaptor subunit [Halarcobacter sp.]
MSNIVSNSTDVLVVLNNIKALREFEGTKEEFWNFYLENTLQVTKSSYILVLELFEENYKQKYLIDNIGVDDSSEEIAKTILLNRDKTLKNSYSYAPINLKINKFSQAYILSFKIENLDNTIIIASIIIDRANTQQFNETVVRTQLINDVYLNYAYFNRKSSTTNLPIETQEKTPLLNNRIYEILELLNLIKDEKKFLLACMKLVNELSLKFDSSRVSIGWKTNEYINLIAISHLEKFDEKSEIVKKLQNVYEECADQEKTVYLPTDNTNLVTKAHEDYSRINLLNTILSIPIKIEDKVIGVVTLEKLDDSFDKKDIILLELSLEQLNIWLYDLQQEDRWIGKKLLDGTKKQLANFLGSDNTLLKFFSILISLVLLYSIFFKWEYKIEVTATLDTDNIAYVQAPYDSYIKNVNYYPGDYIKKDETLIELDEEELLLKQLEMEADVIRYTREAEKARARDELADMNIAIAKVIQAKASLKKVEYYLNQSKIKSPFDGVIIEGDKKELISAPVSKGDILLKIANAKDIFIRFKISEKYIDEIKINDEGELKLLSRPELYFPIKVTNIVPTAQVDGKNGNVFMLKAKTLSPIESWWRPGMSGVAKINIGQRRVIWIATHKTIDFLRMYFWL